MGLLSLGTPLPWEEAKNYADYVRNQGINQFLSIYHKLKDKQKDCLLWGDEVEYMVIAFDEENKNAKLSLRVFEILDELQKEEEAALKNLNSDEVIKTSWKPEYGGYMLEGTPGVPYGGTLKELLQVESNMKFRRQLAAKYMKPNEVPITITSFPNLGCQGQFLEPHYEPKGEASRSLFVPDQIINPHARFQTLTANIRKRRGSKVAINMPIFHDTKTPKPFIDPTIPRNRNLFPEDKEADEGMALPDHIYMDAMVFGMGCCCLQITFQATNIEEARRLYDQLANMGPIMLALTAAAPIYRGYLSDVDCRWNVIAGSVDDRTKEERGLEPLKNNRFIINKSRYDSIDCYISTDNTLKPEYNDLDLVYDKEICKNLMDNGIDELLARHIAHLFIRDPLVIFEESLEPKEDASDHFENIQSTNWQTMRFKPPPPNSTIGWRVEFRSMEIQITDFENAAFAVFIVLLTRAILSYGLNFYIPISKVDENMKIAHKRDAVLNEKFWFRKNVFENEKNNIIYGNENLDNDGSDSKSMQQPNGHNYTDKNPISVEDEYEQMSIDKIINGSCNKFPGLITLINRYLESINIDIESRCILGKYLEFVKKRAKGEIQTTAKWIREFVRSHPKYQEDSVVTQEINYDLMKIIEKIQKGEANVPELLGNFKV
ncbi:glutamate-cysteine ligase-domain-containing protein [Glomus cerebriforme]|uniref:Glutamate--cysteine ligase n=1 Tax=Glomus cerebriforme TaxID=658196 RepID=A0A397SUE0_9GLOM|nr:glutamate-cysteine ligase-domain-containing protein [Glomus cerebriforme]